MQPSMLTNLQILFCSTWGETIILQHPVVLGPSGGCCTPTRKTQSLQVLHLNTARHLYLLQSNFELAGAEIVWCPS